MSKTAFSLKKLLFFILLSLFIIAIIVFTFISKKTATENFNSTSKKFNNITENISLNSTSAPELRNLSVDFSSLKSNLFLSKDDRITSHNLSSISKYLSYREDIYSTLILLAKNQKYLTNPKPNQFQNIINSIDSNISSMQNLYTNSDFIQSKVHRSPEDFYNFSIDFINGISKSSTEQLLAALDSYFYKKLPSQDVLSSILDSTQHTPDIPIPSSEELDTAYMKNLKTLTQHYNDLINKELPEFNKITPSSSVSLINEYYSYWNSNLNALWTSLQENLPTPKLKELEFHQLKWIATKKDKTKFEQAQMTKERTILLFKTYIYQQS